MAQFWLDPVGLAAIDIEVALAEGVIILVAANQSGTGIAKAPKVQRAGGEFMSSKSRVEIPQEKVDDFCKRHHIRKLSLFGSVLGEEFGPESDIDVLVEFEPGLVIGLLRMAGMEIELSEMLGRKVDLRTPEDLSRYFRKEVLDTAETQYAQG